MAKLNWSFDGGSYEAQSRYASYLVRVSEKYGFAELFIDKGDGRESLGKFGSSHQARTAAQREDDRLAQQRAGMRSNPFSMSTPEKTAIGIGLVAAVAAGIYYATRPASTSTTGVGRLGSFGLGLLGSLTPGQSIFAGQSVWSGTRNHQLIMQTDGNLVIYDDAGEAIWASGTRGSGGVRAVMQTDGNFVIYRSRTSMAPSEAVWSSATYGNPGAWITMQNDGNLVIYTQSGQPLWASETGRRY